MYATRTAAEIRLMAAAGHPFWSKVRIDQFDFTCWAWRGKVDRDGYGYLGRDRAHRIAWELANRTDILDGRIVMHTCDSPPCCNPKHLVAATGDDNVADRVSKQRSARGAFNGRARLSNADVLGVYSATGSYAEIGRRFGVSKWTVADIKTGRNWAWLTGVNSQNTQVVPTFASYLRSGGA